MPGSPSRSDVHVNKPLTNISEAYLQSTDAFIGRKVFPSVSVEKRSDLYFSYDKADFNRDEFALRAPGAESRLANFNLATTPYLCDVWSLGVDLDDQTLANADAPLNLEADTTKFLMNKLLISIEKQFVSNFFTTGIWTGSSTGADITTFAWKGSSQDPVADLQNEADAIHLNTGYYPNTIVFGATAYRTFLNHSAVLDRIKYTQTGVVSEDLVAGILGIPRVFVARAIEETKKEGQSGSTMAALGTTDDVFMCYSAPSASLMTPTAGYIFNWARYLTGGAGQRVMRFEMPHKRSTRIEVEAAYDMKQIAPLLGSYMIDVDATS